MVTLTCVNNEIYLVSQTLKRTLLNITEHVTLYNKHLFKIAARKKSCTFGVIKNINLVLFRIKCNEFIRVYFDLGCPKTFYHFQAV